MRAVTSLNLALVQSATYWHDPERNRAHFQALFAHVNPDTDLVILPEMFTTGFTMASAEVAEPIDGATTQWLQRVAADNAMAVCGSIVVRAGERDFRNRLLFADPAGVVHTYDKRHLFRMADEHHHYAAGDRRLVIEYRGWRICPMICYDLRFPVFFRNRRDIDLYMCVANWPAPRASQWRTLLAARAIENQCFVAAVNIVGVDGNGVAYAGDSLVIDPTGTVLADAGDEARVISARVDLDTLSEYRRVFPAWRDADAFELTVEPEGDE